jgi:hypothetical protein
VIFVTTDTAITSRKIILNKMYFFFEWKVNLNYKKQAKEVEMFYEMPTYLTQSI